MAVQPAVDSRRIVVGREVRELPLKIPGVPEQHVVQELSPQRPDQPFHEGMRHGNVRHGLDLINLEDPKGRLPSVRRKQRVMVGTEMPGCALAMNSIVEHATEVRAVDVSVMHGEADDATGELVHDDKHPIALKHDRLAPKEVDAPQTVAGVADERQPRRAVSAAGPIVFDQDAAHEMLVDVDAERPQDDAGKPRTAESRIAGFEFDNGLNERLAWPLRTGFPWAVVRGEQATVLAPHQCPMEGEERRVRVADADGDFSDSARTQKQRPESAHEPTAARQVRCSLARSAKDD